MATADLRWKVCAFGIHWWAPKEPIPVTRMYILAPQPQQPWPWLWSLDFRQLVGLKLLVECWFPTKLKNSRSGFIAVGKSRFGSSFTGNHMFESLDLPRSMSATRRGGFLPLLGAAVVSFLALFFRVWWSPWSCLWFFRGVFFSQKTQIFIQRPLQRKGLKPPVGCSSGMTQLSPVGSTRTGRMKCDELAEMGMEPIS